VAIVFAASCFLGAAYLAARADDASESFDARQLEAAGETDAAVAAARDVPASALNGEALVTEARALAALGEHRAAVAAYRRAVRRRPADWILRRDLALVLAWVGERSKAADQMGRALALNPKMAIPPGFATRSDLKAFRRQQRRAAEAIGDASVTPP
jgi:Flp pilus assembly protein TadD